MGRTSAQEVRQLAYDAWKNIWATIHQYNEIQNGKWREYIGMFPMEVNKSPIFVGEKMQEWIEPESFEAKEFETSHSDKAFDVWCQGSDEKVGVYSDDKVLPVLSKWNDSTFFEIYSCSSEPISWSVKEVPEYLDISDVEGIITDELRVYVSLNLGKLEQKGAFTAEIELNVGDEVFILKQPVFNPELSLEIDDGFVEACGVVQIPATSYSQKIEHAPYFWKDIKGLGIHGAVVKACPENATPLDHEWGVAQNNPYLEYKFTTFNKGWVNITIYTLPTHIISKEHGATYAVSLNSMTEDGPTIIHDQSINTRNERFLEQVEQGFTKITAKHYIRNAGEQTLLIHMCDPGIIFDHIGLYRIIIGYISEICQIPICLVSSLN